MVWVFRISLGLMILAYVAWQAWPVADLLSHGATASDIWALAGGASIPGAVTAAAWIAVILLYAVSGVLTAAGLSWAPGAWFLAFGGEILLRLDLSPAGAPPPLIDMAGRAAEAFRLAGVGLDPAPLSMAALLGVGLLVVALGAWRGWKGAALTRSWAVLPVWG
ncbi:hypothetical protein [Brevundimonas sp. R86498]|uniref:hypothetical protein n=1 Tax=Brevundimonas sp. R86498 TaxID=3093845 RepID=UPI0037C652C4